MVILFTIKNNLCAGDYAATVCAIKSTQLKQGRTARCVFSTQEQYPSLFGKRFNFFVIHKTTFRTRKRFHNKQYTSKSKDQPLESERTHFNTGFNNGGIAMHRPTIIFLLSHKITTVQQKKQPTGTINQIKQSEKTIHATIQSITPKKQNITNTKNHLSINRKTNHKNNHNKQSTQSLKKTRSKQTIITNTTSDYEKMQYFLNIKISQTATSSEPTAKDKTTYYTLR